MLYLVYGRDIIDNDIGKLKAVFKNRKQALSYAEAYHRDRMRGGILTDYSGTSVVSQEAGEVDYPTIGKIILNLTDDVIGWGSP